VLASPHRIQFDIHQHFDRDAGIELVRLWDEPRLFWHKSNSNDPDRNVWSIFAFSLGFRFSAHYCPTSTPTRRSAEMAAAAGDAGGPSALVGTSGSACAGPKVLVFPSEIALRRAP